MLGIDLLLFEEGADEGLAMSNLPVLSFLTGGVVPHPASAVVGVVGVVTVGAGDGMVTGGESLLSGHRVSGCTLISEQVEYQPHPTAYIPAPNSFCTSPTHTTTHGRC